MYKAYPVTISKTLYSIFLVLVAIIAKYARTPLSEMWFMANGQSMLKPLKTRQKLQDFECVAQFLPPPLRFFSLCFKLFSWFTDFSKLN